MVCGQFFHLVGGEFLVWSVVFMAGAGGGRLVMWSVLGGSWSVVLYYADYRYLEQGSLFGEVIFL